MQSKNAARDAEIEAAYSAGGVTFADLGRKYGISGNQIASIVAAERRRKDGSDIQRNIGEIKRWCDLHPTVEDWLLKSGSALPTMVLNRLASPSRLFENRNGDPRTLNELAAATDYEWMKDNAIGTKTLKILRTILPYPDTYPKLPKSREFLKRHDLRRLDETVADWLFANLDHIHCQVAFSVCLRAEHLTNEGFKSQWIRYTIDELAAIPDADWLNQPNFGLRSLAVLRSIPPFTRAAGTQPAPSA